ncbi:MAG: hypothetical protein HYZ52_05935 [Candidatus Omnitrophica bacterium]|nr:hypothetical protein [Candidatus Omnitrophota bacterium]
MKRLFGLLMVLTVLGAVPVYAEGVSGSQTVSFIDFSAAPENYGAPQRLLQKRYDDYRQGRFVITTLDTQHMR